ncbi:iduronate-2-sulfatase, partial [Bacteroides xylanisolvens]
MKNRISIKYAFFCGTACCISSILRAQQDASQMNVLFIMADDMRPELGCYGVD